MGALLFVLALFFAGLWLFRNWQRLVVNRGQAPRLRVLEVKSLGARHALYVVGYEDQRLLVASSPAGVNLLTHLPGSSEPAATPLESPASGKMSFGQALHQVLAAK